MTGLAAFPGLLLDSDARITQSHSVLWGHISNINKMPLTDHEGFSCSTLLLTLSTLLYILDGTNNRPWLPPTMKFELSLALAAALFLPILVNAAIIVGSPGTYTPAPVVTTPAEPAVPSDLISIIIGFTTPPPTSTRYVVSTSIKCTTPTSTTRSVVSTSKYTTPTSSTRSVVSTTSEYTTPTSSTHSVVSTTSEYTTPPSTTPVVTPSIVYTTPASPTPPPAPPPSNPEPPPPANSPSQAPTSEIEGPQIVASFNDATMPPSSAAPVSSGGGGGISGGGGGETAPVDSPPTGISSNVGGTRPSSTNAPNSFQASCPGAPTGQCVRGVFVVAPIFAYDLSGPSCPRWSTQLPAFQLRGK